MNVNNKQCKETKLMAPGPQHPWPPYFFHRVYTSGVKIRAVFKKFIFSSSNREHEKLILQK